MHEIFASRKKLLNETPIKLQFAHQKSGRRAATINRLY